MMSQFVVVVGGLSGKRLLVEVYKVVNEWELCRVVKEV
jgi:hypothetical protein